MRAGGQAHPAGAAQRSLCAWDLETCVCPGRKPRSCPGTSACLRSRQLGGWPLPGLPSGGDACLSILARLMLEWLLGVMVRQLCPSEYPSSCEYVGEGGQVQHAIAVLLHSLLQLVLVLDCPLAQRLPATLPAQQSMIVVPARPSQDPCTGHRMRSHLTALSWAMCTATASLEACCRDTVAGTPSCGQEACSR